MRVIVLSRFKTLILLVSSTVLYSQSFGQLRRGNVIAESKAAVEINGDPYRLDLEPRWVREARKRKIKFVISVDAHSTGALFNLQYGVRMARRGWVRRGEVLNTLTPKAFAKSVKPL